MYGDGGCPGFGWPLPARNRTNSFVGSQTIACNGVPNAQISNTATANLEFNPTAADSAPPTSQVACDTDTQNVYATYKGVRRLKVTHRAKACAKQHVDANGDSCAVLTYFNMKVSVRVVELKPTRTLAKYRLDGGGPSDVDTGCHSLDTNLGKYVQTRQFSGKYSVVRKDASDPVAKPKLRVVADASINPGLPISETDREAILKIRKISGWKFLT
jgi:hypothetical protein